MRHKLDAAGLKCPLPVLKARRLLRDLPVGDEVEVTATDPGAAADFTHFCRVTGYTLLSIDKDGDRQIITHRK